MLRKRSVYAIAATALLAVAVGCAPDAETISGPDPAFSRGHAAGGLLDRFRDVVPFDTGVIPAAPFGPCAFPINVVGVDKVVGQLFGDRRSGVPTHIVFHIEAKAILTNLDTGFFNRDNTTFTAIIHLDDGTITEIGGRVRITVQGEGMLFQDTGIITFDPSDNSVSFEAGPHEIFHGADFCEASDRPAA